MLKKEIDLLSSSREESSMMIDNLRADLEESDALQNEMNSYKDRLLPNQERINKLSLSEQHLRAEFEGIKAEGIKLEQEKEIQIAAKKELDELLAMDDETDKKVLEPAREEYHSILEEIDTLAKSISSLQDQNAANKAALVSGFASQKKAIQEFEENVRGKEQSIEQKIIEGDNLQKAITEVKESCQNDVSRFEDLRMKYIDAKKAQVAIIESLTTQREKEKQLIQQSFGTRVSHEMLKLEAMDCGIELLMKADELESELKNITMFA